MTTNSEPPAVAVGTRALVMERLRVLVVAGVTVGVLVAGIGSRVAMLLLRLTSSDVVNGVTSDDGFTIGRFTLAGTYNLLVLGAMVGVIGAAAYRAVAPWLLGPRWFRRATVAAGSGAVVGAILVQDDGIDFKLLTPTWFAIALFVALPAAFGWLMAAAVDRASAVDSWTLQGRRKWALPVVLVVLFPFTVLALVFAAAVLLVWVNVRRHVARPADRWVAVRIAVRTVWLTIAVVGLLDLASDVASLT